MSRKCWICCRENVLHIVQKMCNLSVEKWTGAGIRKSEQRPAKRGGIPCEKSRIRGKTEKKACNFNASAVFYLQKDFCNVQKNRRMKQTSGSEKQDEQFGEQYAAKERRIPAVSGKGCGPAGYRSLLWLSPYIHRLGIPGADPGGIPGVPDGRIQQLEPDRRSYAVSGKWKLGGLSVRR